MTTRSRTVSRKDFIFLSRDPCGYHLDALTRLQGSRCALHCKIYGIDAAKRRSSSGRNASLNSQHKDLYARKMYKTQRILPLRQTNCSQAASRPEQADNAVSAS